MAEDTTTETETESTLAQDIRNIVGGVVGIALVIIPVILIRKLVKTIENADSFKAIERNLS